MMRIFRCDNCEQPYLTCHQDDAKLFEACLCGGAWVLEASFPWDRPPTPQQRLTVNQHLALTKAGATVH